LPVPGLGAARSLFAQDGPRGLVPVMTLYFQCIELNGVNWQVSAECGFEGNVASFSHIAEVDDHLFKSGRDSRFRSVRPAYASAMERHLVMVLEVLWSKRHEG
jgi:hypothetical protein